MSETASALLSRLRDLQREHAGKPASERGIALERALRQALDALPSPDALAAIDGAKRALRAAAEASAPGASGESAVVAMRETAARESAARERIASLESEVARLKRAVDRETDAVRVRDTRIQELESQMRPVAGAATSGGSVGSIALLRRGIRESIDGKRPTAESLGLPVGEARLFRFVQALVRFLLDLEQLRLGMMKEHELGAAGGGTQMVRILASQLKGRMRDVLDDKEGSLQKLEKTLRANQHFPLALDQAYRDAFSDAVARLLETIQPEPILEGHKGLIGYNYEAAWRTLSKRHFDLSQMVAMELWALYMKEPFQRRMNAAKTDD